MQPSFNKPLLPPVHRDRSVFSSFSSVFVSFLLLCAIFLILSTSHDPETSLAANEVEGRSVRRPRRPKDLVVQGTPLQPIPQRTQPRAEPRAEATSASRSKRSKVLIRGSDESSNQDAIKKPAMCSNARYGYEVLFGPCKDIKHYKIHLTFLGETIYVPMVLDRNAYCKGEKCTSKDKWNCCQQRRSCVNWNKDVGQNCPDTKVVNPYKYAFCRTMPCSLQDEDICCIPHAGALFERTKFSRSRRAQIMPMAVGGMNAPVVPEIRFGQHDVAWFDAENAQKVGGATYMPLVNFMATWGDDYGWKSGAWVKFRNEGEEPKYRELQLNVHAISCEDSVDDLDFFESELDTYLVSCPRFCMGKTSRVAGMDVFEWEFHRGKLTRKNKVIPLYDNRDRDPVKYGEFSKEGTFVSRAIPDKHANRLWVRVPYRNDGRDYWMPTIDIMKNGKIGKFADQIVREVQGCGGKNLFENEWFTSSSPICVAARLGKLYGGDELIEVTIGPTRKKYKGCKHGGIKSSSLTDTSLVKRSFRLAPHGTEMLRKGGGWLSRRFYKVWKHTIDHVREEGPARIITKLALKIGFHIGWTIMCGSLIALTATGAGAPVAVLLIVGLIFIRPAINTAVSVLVDTTVDWLFPRVSDYFKRQLDLGPTNSDRRKRLMTLTETFKHHYDGQVSLVDYAYSVLFEAVGQVFKIFEITGVIHHASAMKSLKAFRFVRTRPSVSAEALVGVGGAEDESLDEEDSMVDPPIIDFSYAFIDALQQAARDLFSKIVPHDSSQEPTYSRLDVFGWMVGLDVSKLVGTKEEINAIIERECIPPNCILKQISTTADGTLQIPVHVLPYLAQNLGVSFELKDMRINKKWFSMQECGSDVVYQRCRCGENTCNAGRICSPLKDCLPSDASFPECPDSGPVPSDCECSHEICVQNQYCGEDGFCSDDPSGSEYADIWYFALENDDTSLSAKLVSNVCAQDNSETCQDLTVNVEPLAPNSEFH